MPRELSGQTIVHVVTTVRHGGAERVVLELARHQRSHGARPMVICLHDLGDLLPAFAEADVPVALLDGAERPGIFRTAWRLAGWLERTAPAVVHTHNSAPQIAAGLGQRLRHWRHGDTVLVHTEHGRLADLRPALLQLRRWSLAEFDAVIAVSDDARAQMLHHGLRGPHGVDVVANGVDLERFSRRAPRRADEPPRIVHVGRLDRIKGQDVLLAAMTTVHQRLPSARLTVVGDGPTRVELETQNRASGLQAVVEFAGATADVRPFLQQADLFVLPSRSEGVSLALLEALATGLAVVVTDVGGNREVLGASDCGVVVPAEQPERLAGAMVSVLERPGVAATEGAAARRLAEARFGFDHTAESYAEYYERPRGWHTVGSAA